jgi:hypothetical protein
MPFNSGRGCDTLGINGRKWALNNLKSQRVPPTSQTFNKWTRAQRNRKAITGIGNRRMTRSLNNRCNLCFNDRVANQDQCS